MSDLPTLRYRYMGEGEFRALPHYHELCDKVLVTGELYSLAVIEERSPASHSHYFAALNEAYKNMPDEYGFKNVEHLRKWTLIRTGWCKTRSHMFSSPRDAHAAVLINKPYMDDYDIVTIEGALVTIYTALSQSMKAMGKRDFQASKTAVLDYVAGLLHIEREVLQKNAGRAA